MDYKELYISGCSIPEVSEITGLARSTVRFRLKKLGLLRTRHEAIINAGERGRLGSGLRGKKRTFSEDHKRNISIAKKGVGRGTSKKPNGYIEVTMGENKGRSVHVVLMENKVGRKLYANECVHHIDGDRANNEIGNLQLMTRSEHARLHGIDNCKNRSRDKKGKFK